MTKNRLLGLILVTVAVSIPALAMRRAKAVSMAKVRETYFRFDLPRGWNGGPSHDPTLWQYASSNQNEQLSVSIHASRTSISAEDRPAILNSFLATRLKAETDRARSRNLQISEPKVKEQGAACVASYSGFHPEAKRRFANFTAVNEKVIANFCYEAVEMSQNEFEKNRKQIFKGVGIAE